MFAKFIPCSSLFQVIESRPEPAAPRGALMHPITDMGIIYFRQDKSKFYNCRQ
jgi:hypothetical protein